MTYHGKRTSPPARVISQRAAEGHVERVLTKLGSTSRAQVAAWIAARSTEQDS